MSSQPSLPIDLPLELLERAVREFVGAGHLSGASVGLVVDDGLAWTHAVGATALGGVTPIDQGTLFRIASITKTFTATAIVRLRDQGRLRLDDPLVRHVPEADAIRSPFGPIEDVTLRRLLTHTAGMPIDIPAPLSAHVYPFEGYAIDCILRSIADIRLFAAPGTLHQYSNVGFQLLGEVVARAAGIPYADYVLRELAVPLGMTATVFEPAGALRARVAQGYQAYDHSDQLTAARDLDSRDLGALGGLWSSVEDLARWISAQLGPYRPEPTGSPLLSAASLLEMHRQTVLADETWTESQGLGWAGVRDHDMVVVEHGGGQPGYITNIAMLLRERIGAVVLLNGLGRASQLATSLLRLARPAVAGARERETAAVPAARTPVPPAWSELTGVYRDPDRAFTYHVTVSGGGLAIRAGERADERLAAVEGSPDRYAVTAWDGVSRGYVTFVRAASGRVAWINFDGYPFAEETVAPRYSV